MSIWFHFELPGANEYFSRASLHLLATPERYTATQIHLTFNSSQWSSHGAADDATRLTAADCGGAVIKSTLCPVRIVDAKLKTFAHLTADATAATSYRQTVSIRSIAEMR